MPFQDIKLFINSPGGSVTAGMGIYDAMQVRLSSPPLLRPQHWRHRPHGLTRLLAAACRAADDGQDDFVRL